MCRDPLAARLSAYTREQDSVFAEKDIDKKQAIFNIVLSTSKHWKKYRVQNCPKDKFPRRDDVSSETSRMNEAR